MTGLKLVVRSELVQVFDVFVLALRERHAARKSPIRTLLRGRTGQADEQGGNIGRRRGIAKTKFPGSPGGGHFLESSNIGISVRNHDWTCRHLDWFGLRRGRRNSGRSGFVLRQSRALGAENGPHPEHS